MRLLLDTNILSRLCHPTQAENRPLGEWLESGLSATRRATICVPEIVDYEVRRGLLHVALRSGRPATRSLLRLDLLSETLEYLPLKTATMRRAARLWAEARHVGRPTAGGEALDGDVILAAQALEAGGAIVTENIRHLARFAPAYRWQEVDLRSGSF